jgi:hypothetical protein
MIKRSYQYYQNISRSIFLRRSYQKRRLELLLLSEGMKKVKIDEI